MIIKNYLGSPLHNYIYVGCALTFIVRCECCAFELVRWLLKIPQKHHYYKQASLSSLPLWSYTVLCDFHSSSILLNVGRCWIFIVDVVLQVIQNNLNPRWKSFEIPVNMICNGDYDRVIKVRKLSLQFKCNRLILMTT